MSILVALSDTQHLVKLGINQCVGLHNERHFVLFMYVFNRWCDHVVNTFYRAYLVIGSFFFSFLGFPQAMDALGLRFVVRFLPGFSPAISDFCQHSAMDSYHAPTRFHNLLYTCRRNVHRRLYHAALAPMGSRTWRNFCRGARPQFLS